MTQCVKHAYYFCISWPWECAPLPRQQSFQELLRERDRAMKCVNKSHDKTFWREVIDDINELLNRIRINETPLRPAIFARSSYPAY